MSGGNGSTARVQGHEKGQQPESRGCISVDAAVVGGGPAGLAAAAALAAVGLSVAILDRESAEKRTEAGFDGRTTALTYGSANVLKGIGAWDGMDPHAQPIVATNVVDRFSPIHLMVDQEAIGDHPYGFNVENGYIRRALIDRFRSFPGATDLSPCSVAAIDTTDDAAVVTLADGRIVRAALLIGADGRGSMVREAANIRARRWDYDQTALVFNIRHEKPHQGIAVEHLMDGGPFAIVPMIDEPETDGGDGHRSAIVWCERRADAPAFLSLPDDRFDAEVEWRAAGRLGRIRHFGQRFSYPISGLHAERYAAHRIALTGEAAHAVHPIAAQGLNLSIRDAAALAEVIAGAKREGADIGTMDVLKAYERWRRFDTLQTIAYTDTFLRVFLTRRPAIRLARNAVLGAINASLPLKRRIIRDAMGFAGPQRPSLMDGLLPHSRPQAAKN